MFLDGRPELEPVTGKDFCTDHETSRIINKKNNISRSTTVSIIVGSQPPFGQKQHKMSQQTSRKDTKSKCRIKQEEFETRRFFIRVVSACSRFNILSVSLFSLSTIAQIGGTPPYCGESFFKKNKNLKKISWSQLLYTKITVLDRAQQEVKEKK